MIRSKATARGERGSAESVGVNDFGVETVTDRPLSQVRWLAGRVLGAVDRCAVPDPLLASGSSCWAAPETGPAPHAATSSSAQAAIAPGTLFTCVATFRRGA